MKLAASLASHNWYADPCVAPNAERRRLPLCSRYEAVLFDMQPVRCLGEKSLVDRAIVWAIGIAGDGQWEVLDAWQSSTEFGLDWSQVFHDLKVRGVERVGVFTFPRCEDVRPVARAAFPSTIVLPCTGQLRRDSLMRIAPRDRSAASSALDAICGASSVAAARQMLDFAALSAWATRRPDALHLWRAALEQLAPFYVLTERLRGRVRSGDAVVQRLRDAVSRGVTRHGDFADGEAALSFVHEVLLQRAARLSQGAGAAAPGRSRSRARPTISAVAH